MAVFKVPRITTTQRSGLVLEASEIVYDVDQKTLFGGDGIIPGGFSISGFNVEKITLSANDIANKRVVLSKTPAVPSAVMLTPEEGIPQINGIDFTVSGNTLSWEGLGLDNFLEINEVLIIQY